VDVVVIEDYGKGVINPLLLMKIIRMAKAGNKPVIVDPKVRHFSYYKGATVITPNRKEAYAAFNGHVDQEERSLESVGRGLMDQLESEAVLMTLGEDGMALFERNGSVTRIPTVAREVFDVSGAGDTVVAVYTLCAVGGASPILSAHIANCAAGIVVGKVGVAIVEPKELLNRLKRETGRGSS